MFATTTRRSACPLSASALLLLLACAAAAAAPPSNTMPTAGAPNPARAPVVATSAMHTKPASAKPAAKPPSGQQAATKPPTTQPATKPAPAKPATKDAPTKPAPMNPVPKPAPAKPAPRPAPANTSKPARVVIPNDTPYCRFQRARGFPACASAAPGASRANCRAVHNALCKSWSARPGPLCRAAVEANCLEFSARGTPVFLDCLAQLGPRCPRRALAASLKCAADDGRGNFALCQSAPLVPTLKPCKEYVAAACGVRPFQTFEIGCALPCYLDCGARFRGRWARMKICRAGCRGTCLAARPRA